MVSCREGQRRQQWEQCGGGMELQDEVGRGGVVRWGGWQTNRLSNNLQVDGPSLPPLPDNERTEVLTVPQEKE